MARPIKWVDKGFKAIKVKVDINTHKQYKEKLKKQNLTAQEHLSEKIKEEIHN